MKAINRLIYIIYVNLALAKYAPNGIVLLFRILLPSRIKKYLTPRLWFRKKTLTTNEPQQLSLCDFRPFFTLIRKVFKTQQDILPMKIIEQLNRLKNKLSSDDSLNKEIIIEHINEHNSSDLIPHIEQKTSKTDELGSHIKKLWDELSLAQFTGEEMIHHISSLVNKGKELKKQVTDSIQLNITEFLQEELAAFPSREELNDFFNDITELSSSVGYLQAQINKLMSTHEIN